ncbi:MAG: MFS transporter [Candidatus Colwellbacteria bacterium]|nr:MFS transporter [Candidatus Colwellbacteria bacterium]
MEKKILGLRRNVFFLGLVSLFNDFSNEMIQSVMPVFLRVNLGVSPIGIGIIEGAADAVASFLKIFSGWFSDKIGRRKLPAILGYALSVATRPFFALTSNFSQVLTLRIVDRVGKGFRDAPRDALLSSSADHEELGKSFGYHRAMDAIGGTLGPLTTFLLLPFIFYNYKILFVFAFAVGLLAIFSFAFVKEIKRPDGVKVQPLNLKLFKEHRSFSLFIASVFLFGLGTLPVTLMLLQPIEMGVKLGNVPLIYFVYSITFVLSAIPLGKLSDKIGQRVIITSGFVFAIASYMSLAFIHSITATILAFMLFGLYSASTDGIERALAARIISEEMLGTAQGILNAAVGLSSLLAGLIGGILWTGFGSDAAFVYGAVMSSIGLIVFSAVNLTRLRRGAPIS